MNEKLEREFDYYLKNQDELVKQYNGKFIAIKDCYGHKIQLDFVTSFSSV